MTQCKAIICIGGCLGYLVLLFVGWHDSYYLDEGKWSGNQNRATGPRHRNADWNAAYATPKEPGDPEDKDVEGHAEYRVYSWQCRGAWCRYDLLVSRDTGPELLVGDSSCYSGNMLLDFHVD